jgi:hypothetical protein
MQQQLVMMMVLMLHQEHILSLPLIHPLYQSHEYEFDLVMD